MPLRTKYFLHTKDFSMRTKYSFMRTKSIFTYKKICMRTKHFLREKRPFHAYETLFDVRKSLATNTKQFLSKTDFVRKKGVLYVFLTFCT